MTISLQKTGVSHELMETPSTERDASWMKLFFKSLPNSAFKLSEDKPVIRGPDGFLYLNLLTPENNETYAATTLNENLDQLLSKGYGIVLNANKPGYTFGINLGKLWSYKELGSFLKNPNGDLETLCNRSELETTGYKTLDNEDGSVFYAEPSESKLPKYVRDHIKSFLAKNFQLENIGLIILFDLKNTPTESFIFSFTDTHFADEEKYQQCMEGINWHLPDHYVAGTFSDRTKEKFQFYLL